MPPAVGVEHLFAGVQDLDRAPRHHGQAGDAELQVEGLGLAAERPAHGRLDDPYGRGIQAQDRGQLAVQVVGHLGGRPHRQAPVLVVAADGAVRLDGGVGAALEEVLALHHHIGSRHALVHLAEAEPHPLGDVAVPPLPARLVDEGTLRASIRRERLRRIEAGGQFLVLDADQRERPDRGVLVHRRHRRHPVPDVAHPLHAQRVFVGRPGNDAVADRHVPARDDGVHALERERPGGIDGEDAGVWVRAPQDLPVQHPRERDVVGVRRLARGLGQPVHLALRLAYDREAGPRPGTRLGRVAPCIPQGKIPQGRAAHRATSRTIAHSPVSSPPVSVPPDSIRNTAAADSTAS